MDSLAEARVEDDATPVRSGHRGAAMGRAWLAAPEVGFGDVVCYLTWLEIALLIGVNAAGPGSIEGSALVADAGAG